MPSGAYKKLSASKLEYIIENLRYDSNNNIFYDSLRDAYLPMRKSNFDQFGVCKTARILIQDRYISAQIVAFILGNNHQFEGRIFPINGDRGDCRIENMYLVENVDKYAALSAERVRHLFSYDCDTGLLTWRNSTIYGNKSVGTMDKKGYLWVGIDGRSYALHRVAWLHYYGKWPDKMIDHKDGHPSNNAISNLRDVPMSINAQNKRSAPSNAKTTKVLGVYWNKRIKKYQAQIKKDKIWYNCGTHDTIEAAQAAYIEMKRKLHPGNML